jgi:methionyl aminopeptidase
VNLDISTYNAGGYHGDLNETFCVGNVDSDGQRVVQTAFECLAAALALVKPGTLYRDLGTTIEKVAKANKCSVVRTYCGHGIGSLFHTIPNIPHYGKNKAKGTMKVGHVFTIEPMINEKGFADRTWDDNWTAVTTGRFPVFRNRSTKAISLVIRRPSHAFFFHRWQTERTI